MERARRGRNLVFLRELCTSGPRRTPSSAVGCQPTAPGGLANEIAAARYRFRFCLLGGIFSGLAFQGISISFQVLLIGVYLFRLCLLGGVFSGFAYQPGLTGFAHRGVFFRFCFSGDIFLGFAYWGDIFSGFAYWGAAVWSSEDEFVLRCWVFEPRKVFADHEAVPDTDEDSELDSPKSACSWEKLPEPEDPPTDVNILTMAEVPTVCDHCLGNIDVGTPMVSWLDRFPGRPPHNVFRLHADCAPDEALAQGFGAQLLPVLADFDWQCMDTALKSACEEIFQQTSLLLEHERNAFADSQRTVSEAADDSCHSTAEP